MKYLFRSTLVFLSFAVAGLMAQAALLAMAPADAAVPSAQVRHHHKKHHRKHAHRNHASHVASGVVQNAVQS
jgi:F420-0:gamma-glutamyl ligase